MTLWNYYNCGAITVAAFLAVQQSAVFVKVCSVNLTLWFRMKLFAPHMHWWSRRTIFSARRATVNFFFLIASVPAQSVRIQLSTKICLFQQQITWLVVMTPERMITRLHLSFSLNSFRPSFSYWFVISSLNVLKCVTFRRSRRYLPIKKLWKAAVHFLLSIKWQIASVSGWLHWTSHGQKHYHNEWWCCSGWMCL